MKPNWKVILPIVGTVIVAVSVTVLLISVFKSTPKPDTKYFDMLVKDMEGRRIDEQKHTERVVALYENILTDSRKRDSIRQIQSKTNTIRYEKVPVVINALPNTELTSAIEDEFGQ